MRDEYATEIAVVGKAAQLLQLRVALPGHADSPIPPSINTFCFIKSRHSFEIISSTERLNGDLKQKALTKEGEIVAFPEQWLTEKSARHKKTIGKETVEDIVRTLSRFPKIFTVWDGSLSYNRLLRMSLPPKALLHFSPLF